MKTIIKLSFLVIFVGLFSACSTMSHHMTVIESDAELKPEQGKALVVFLRPSSYAGPVQATVYDGMIYIGTVSANTKTAYQATPGEHMFMVIGESADFMQADLEEGKTYYAQVAARMGIWKARFSFIPQNGQISDEEMNQWLKGTKLTKANEQGVAWAEENSVDIKNKHDEYLPEWQSKDDVGKQILSKSSGK